LESELQRSPSPEFQETSPQQTEIVSAQSESTSNSTSARRSTRGKDVSSSYSSLIPKSRDRTAMTATVPNEPAIIRSDTV
jgi:hypothetical protein